MDKIIKVTSGKGTGLTKLSAFDAALQDAGVSNYNLIYLSSVIPPGFEVKVERPAINENEFGDRLYVVMAQDSTDVVGEEAWAGVGWVMRISDSPSVASNAPSVIPRLMRDPASPPASPNRGESLGGLFVEHHGDSKESVIQSITDSLNSMKSNRKEKYGEIKYEVSGIACDDKPVCALVVAVYKSEKW